MSAPVVVHLERKRGLQRGINMLRPTRRLSAVAVRNAKPGLHPDGGNLYLQVADSGAKSWLFRFGSGGRERWMGLGALHTISLAQAREDATKCRALLRDGIDPIEAKRARRAQNALAQQAGITFADCAARLISSHESGWRNAKHRTQWIQTLSTYAYPVLGSLPVAAIDTPLVLRVLEPIWTTSPRRRAASVAGSRRFSTGPRRAVSATARTRRDGRGISITCCRRSRRFAR